MNPVQARRHLLLACAAFAGSLALAAYGQGTPQRKPDLADAVQGLYFGDVISDSKGSSRSDVSLTVVRVGPNVVRITSDYPRLPVVDVTLTRAMDKIVQARGDTPFVYDPARQPAQLDVSFYGEVSWSGSRR